MKGRKPLPAAVKAAREGRKCPAVPAGPPPECPPHLGPEARREWDRVIPALVEIGLVGAVDTAILAAYCETYAQWVKASAILEEEGYTASGSNGNIVLNPLARWVTQLKDQLRQQCSELGLTPSSRARLQVPGGEEAEDTLEGVLNRVSSNDRRGASCLD